MLIKPKHLDCRREGVTGVVDGYVPGHGGDVWWVKHDDSTDIGAYVFDELELILANTKLRNAGGGEASQTL